MKKAIVFAFCLLTLTNTALAGDIETIRVSCTIPAIPGVNAPALLSQESPVTQKLARNERQNEQKVQELIFSEERTFGQERKKKDAPSKVRTVYAR